MFNRRRFIQGAAGAFSAIGLSQLRLGRQANQYGRSLAQETASKIALLVGIDDYQSNRLGGAVNDVEMQRQLLIHRFGFSPNNILTLKDEQATRTNILEAFENHLYAKAQPGSTVVFHFSGHGERVRPSDNLPEFTHQPGRNCLTLAGRDTSCLNTAIAPYDHDAVGIGTAQDIMGHTLLLIRAALAQKTNNVTFVLDCCYAGGGKRGNAIMRSLDKFTLDELRGQGIGSKPQITNEEWRTQQIWLDRLGWSENDFARAIESPNAPGFFIGAAKAHQLAADYSFNGFSAGAFTCLLTQYLWQSTGSLSKTMLNVANSTTRLSEHSQKPEYDPQPETVRSVEQTPIYHSEPISQPAEGVVVEADAGDGGLTVWLGGLDPQRLAAFDQGAVFSIVNKQSGEVLAAVQQTNIARRGLTTQVRLINSNSTNPAELVGQLLQERTRGIPDQVVLKIALDDTLTSTEQTVASNAFSDSPDFEVEPVRPGKVAHALLGRYTEEIDAYLKRNGSDSNVQPTLNSIGIFSPSQVPLLSGSFGSSGESIEAAIARLRPRFTSLHIGRMLSLMVNGQTSQINVGVEVKHVRDRSGAYTRGSSRDTVLIPRQSGRGVQEIAEDEKIEVTIINNEPEDLHFGIVVIDSAGKIDVLEPPEGADDPTLDIVPRNSSKTLLPLRAVRPYGMAELLVLVSPQSLVSPLNTLRSSAPELDNLRRGDTASDDISAADVMSDLFSAMDTRRGQPSGDVIRGMRLLDVEDVAALSLLFEITP